MRRTPAVAPIAPVIEPNAVYTRHQVRKLFNLGINRIADEVRAGRLRVSVVAGRYWILGRWLLQWIARGERKRSCQPRPHTVKSRRQESDNGHVPEG